MRTVPLSPIDHIFTGVGSYPIEFVFSYKDRIDSARLQSSLEEALEQFPLLRSKLVQHSEHTYGFMTSPDGLSFVSSPSSVSFDDWENHYDLLDPVETREGEPLTRIKLTQTPGGSVLGVSISHALVDGFSYFYFLSSWSKIFKGNTIVAPAHKRELLLLEAFNPKTVTANDLLAGSGLFLCDERIEPSRDQIHWERLQFSRPMLNDLLRPAQSESEVRLSHNDVITAHLWKRYAREWSEDEDNPATYVSCPVDMRRIPATLPPTYFGCAVCLATTTMTREELAVASLGQTAGAIRASVGKANKSYALDSIKVLEALRRQKGLSVVDKIHVMHPAEGLLVTNLSRLPVADLDFGVGSPTGFQILTPARRGAVILPAEDGVEVQVCHPMAT